MARTVLVCTLVLLTVASSSDRRLQFNLTSHWDRGPPPPDENANTTIKMGLQRRLHMSTEFFLVPSTTTSTSIVNTTLKKCVECPEDGVRIFGLFRNEVWVIPVLALSSLTMFLIVAFEVFVLCKACQTTPSRRHLFLGQMLLLGLFAGAGLGGVIALTPTQATCAIVRFGTGVSYALVFASLLVKCVFLISLNSGVYLPAPYQGLLLLFAVLIQVAIGTQWLFTSPPIVNIVTLENVSQHKHQLLVTAEDINSAVTIALCRTSFVDMLCSLIYIVFLIVFVTILAFKSRSIRDNYREATYIGLSIGCTIPTWLIWVLSGFIVQDRHKDACLAFGLIISTVMIFLIMFMPKGRQLAAMGKEGLYIEDREERFSSLSHQGSGYSPSFFHFKPVKYGMETLKRPPITTTGGDHSALYPAPPSYNRIFHCYPNPPRYYQTRYIPGGVFIRPEDGNVYTTLEPTLSTNPNVYFQCGNGVHPGMMY
ncbi:hypothetical protein RN001_014515 [Aquatica leii]|uniref:G-protein coupled receptors family 3 profile domain-containing protein n=1 Tax=Aquatica leii TaxID=1421715 RepID=A0AAN7NZP8_9COLE|nr:hypothetical protein RN001_014515 [Aquatica leii]